MHAIAAKAVCFKEAQGGTGAIMRRPWRTASALPMSSPHGATALVSGGTDTHLLLIDLEKRVDGKVAADLLESVDIIINKNVIPFDTRTLVGPSGFGWALAPHQQGHERGR